MKRIILPFLLLITPFAFAQKKEIIAANTSRLKSIAKDGRFSKKYNIKITYV